MATETDAARDRVLAARVALGDEIETLEASLRTAVDVPAKIRRNPVRTAAVVGGVGFVALRGPTRLFRRAKRTITGGPPPLPKAMLPEEIERALKSMGDDGDKIRGTLERDFYDYAKQAKNRRQALRSLLIVSVARPFLARGARATADWLFRADDEGVQSRLEQIRARTARAAGRAPDGTDVAEAAETAATSVTDAASSVGKAKATGD